MSALWGGSRGWYHQWYLCAADHSQLPCLAAWLWTDANDCASRLACDRPACAFGAQALAGLYSVQPLLPPVPQPAAGAAGAGERDPQHAQQGQQHAQQGPQQVQQDEEERRAREWSVQHVIMPALRLFLRPGRGRASDGSVVELTRLENLYRIFERC